MCFVLAAMIGLSGAAALAAPTLLAPLFSRFAAIRPLHELFALAGALSGGAGVVLGVIGQLGGAARGRWAGAAMAGFIASGAAAIVLGAGSGREYFAWPAGANLLLVASLAALLGAIYRERRLLARRSPEGLWLISFGALFIIAGAIESSLYALAPLAGDYVKDLSLQWHAIDTFFAGLNALLYGCGVLVLADKAKPLRGPALFAAAAFGVLFTFAHHHYVSPQPTIFKSLSVAASMLALVSFFRHLAAYRAQHRTAAERAPDYALWRTIEFWTIVSILSGVLLAVPQINLVTHGTNIIVIHAMGSMIGVGVMLVVACGLRLASRRGAVHWPRIDRAVRLANAALAGLWLALGADGLIEGVGRIDDDYPFHRALRDWALFGFPAFGAMLTIAISLLCAELVRAHARAPSAVLSSRRRAGTVDG